MMNDPFDDKTGQEKLKKFSLDRMARWGEILQSKLAEQKENELDAFLHYILQLRSHFLSNQNDYPQHFINGYKLLLDHLEKKFLKK